MSRGDGLRWRLVVLGAWWLRLVVQRWRAARWLQWAAARAQFVLGLVEAIGAMAQWAGEVDIDQDVHNCVRGQTERYVSTLCARLHEVDDDGLKVAKSLAWRVCGVCGWTSPWRGVRMERPTPV